MIKNERQYRITRSQADQFRTALRTLRAAPADDGSVLLRQAELDALESQLADLEGEIVEYEQLRAGERTVFELDSFEALPRALIQARIASGLSQEELAERLGVAPQQVQRYEATEYGSASLARVAAVIRALGIRVEERWWLAGASGGQVPQEGAAGRSR